MKHTPWQVSHCLAAGLLVMPLALLAVVPDVCAGQPAKEDEPKTIKLVLHPAAEPRPALKYRLLPGFMDLRPGNAAVMYNKIGINISAPGGNEAMDEIGELLDDSPGQFDYRKAKAKLAALKGEIKYLELAACRSSCDWELPLRETDNVFDLLLLELQKTRMFARILAVRVRVQIKEGRLDEAIGTLRTGYAMVRHVAAGPTLINALVGMAISNAMSAELRTLLQQPGAPNLYWALTGLPRPMMDMAAAMDAESQVVYLLVPQFREIDDGPRSLAYWDQFLQQVAEQRFALVGANEAWSLRLVMTALALKGYPQARRGLLEAGYSPERVEAMPVPQVVALYTRQTFEDLRDEMFKWFALPYPQAREGLRQAERLLTTEGRRREIFPVASLLLPAVGAANLASARCDREIALLRTVEALRLYAAGHDGRLPEKLADVTEVPIPLNPITGKPFGYRRSGNTAVLDAPGPPDKSASHYGLRLEIEMRRSRP